MVEDIFLTGPDAVGGHHWSVLLNKEQTAAAVHLAQTVVVLANPVPARSTHSHFYYFFQR